ncbi:hypothetical protein IFM89_019563 [Coptis chinensis]|uniref:DUF155 domain-containing protein n=1 Tax=Coptis chinensis TaxID=261450 RepID=A0A835H5H1_9MAGN|nr:hypothetical protein IFM89_019563 [Coptis chinensis]
MSNYYSLKTTTRLILSCPLLKPSMNILKSLQPSIRQRHSCFSFSKTTTSFSPIASFIVRSFSSIASTQLYDPLPPSSEVYDATEDNEIEDNDPKTTVPVRAYFFSTSIDLKSLIDQNKPNFTPPTSRMTNYAVLKFSNTKCDTTALEGSSSVSNCSYMVVFQYGSIVLFNIRDQEVDAYLKVVEKHASGLLPEMRKDGALTKERDDDSK